MHDGQGSNSLEGRRLEAQQRNAEADSKRAMQREKQEALMQEAVSPFRFPHRSALTLGNQFF